jgi:Glycosyl transferase family 2
MVLFGILIVLVLIWKRNQVVAAEEGEDPVGIPEGFENPATLKLAVASMMRKPTDLALWLEHHRKAGIQKFYIRLEDSPGTASFLKAFDDVYYEEGVSGTYNNYTTQVDRQRDFVNKILPMARKEGMDWVFHIDADELLEGDLKKPLAALPSNILIGKIKNAEAVYKEEEATCFSAEKFIRCDKGGPCTAYVNGKGVGRPVEGVTLGGAHDFVYNGKVDPAVTAQIDFNDFHVLHYDSCNIGTWMEKFKHMSKNAKMDDIVFPYYHKSIEAAKKAVDVYKEYKMRADMSPEWTHVRS